MSAPDETDTGTATLDLGPVIDAGRIVRSEEGFAVTFPDGWTVREPTHVAVEIVLAGSEIGVPEGTNVLLCGRSWLDGAAMPPRSTGPSDS